MFKYLRDFIFGAVFGLTQLVPGVSGGTIAIVFGFYERILAAVNHCREEPKRHLGFLVPFLLGIVSAMLIFSGVIEFLLREFHFPTMLFLTGLIAGTLPMINRQIKANSAPGSKLDLKCVAAFAIPLGLLISLAYLNYGGGSGATASNDVVTLPFMLYIFAIGVLAAAALIIPGLSGSFVLLIAGIYPLAIASVSAIRTWLTNPGDIELMLNIAAVLAPLGIGVVIGVLLVARLVEMLFKRYTKITYYAVFGLMFGSVYALVYPFVVEGTFFAVGTIQLLMGIGAALVGMVAAVVLGTMQKEGL